MKLVLFINSHDNDLAPLALIEATEPSLLVQDDDVAWLRLPRDNPETFDILQFQRQLVASMLPAGHDGDGFVVEGEDEQLIRVREPIGRVWTASLKLGRTDVWCDHDKLRAGCVWSSCKDP